MIPRDSQESAGSFWVVAKGGWEAVKAQNAPVSLQMASRGNAGYSCVCTKRFGDPRTVYWSSGSPTATKWRHRGGVWVVTATFFDQG